MVMKVKKVTFSLPTEIIDKFKKYAKVKYIPSVNAGVREAMEEYSIKIEKEILKKDMLEAAKDPMFMRDLHESIKDFEASDAEATKGMEEW